MSELDGDPSISPSALVDARAPHVLLVGRAGAEADGGGPGAMLQEALERAVVAELAPLELTLAVACDVDQAVAGDEAARPDAIVLLIRSGLLGVVASVEALRRRWPHVPILAVSERPGVTEAVRLMQAGACWYGGLSPAGDLARATRKAVGGERLSPHVPERALGATAGIVGASAPLRRMLRQAGLVAPTRTTVLLLGETGTGKERLAQAIHDASPRRNGPFVAVNCAALAETLLESELFGHEKGAFSGAHTRREGRFKLADGGTIFLDEIGEISLSTQVKLLRVLQERKFERAGGNQTLSVDVRIIAATNRNLREMVERRTFRADLFYRLNVMAIKVPPLRARKEDIPLLVEHFLPRLVLELGLPDTVVTSEGVEELLRYDWPGNVRELENVLQRALVLAEGRPIRSFDLPEDERGVRVAAGASMGGPLVPGASFREIERHVIMTTYEACGRSALRTAKVLGISPRTIHYRLREYRGERGRRLPRDMRDDRQDHDQDVDADQAANDGSLDWELQAVRPPARRADHSPPEN